MAEISTAKFFNMAITVGNSIRRELEQERKWINNKRCKRPDFSSIANYISDPTVGLGVPVTTEEVKKYAHEYNWGD